MFICFTAGVNCLFLWKCPDPMNFLDFHSTSKPSWLGRIGWRGSLFFFLVFSNLSEDQTYLDAWGEIRMRDTQKETFSAAPVGLTEWCRLQTEAVPAGRDHLGDRGWTNPPQDHMTEAKLTRDLRNDNYTATWTILHSWTETWMDLTGCDSKGIKPSNLDQFYQCRFEKLEERRTHHWLHFSERLELILDEWLQWCS